MPFSRKIWVGVVIAALVLITSLMWSRYPAERCRNKLQPGIDDIGLVSKPGLVDPDPEPIAETPRGIAGIEEIYSRFAGLPGIEVGQEYFVATTVELHALGLFTPFGTVNAGELIKVLETDHDERFHLNWAKIEYANISGWIPTWYLTSDPANILPAVTQTSMIATRQTVFEPLPYPMGMTYCLPGKVVQVLSVYEEWTYARIHLYEYTYSYGWIPTVDLIPFSTEKSREAIVREGSALYDLGDGGPALSYEKTTGELTVFIVELQDKYAQIVALGGMQRWVLLDDIISYDPWVK